MSQKSHLERNIVFDGEVGVQRFETVKYPEIEKWCNTGMSQFWRPEEVDITKDAVDFTTLTPAEQHIFTSNLQRQVVLDSVMGREPVECFSANLSLPEYENATLMWTFQEGCLHSRSYTHIIRNVYPNPSKVFDEIEDIDQITELADEIQYYYDNLSDQNFYRECHERGVALENFVGYSEYEHKKAYWLALISANALEGVRFYVSFACSYAFAEILNKMEGNAKIVQLINRDENEHLKLVQLQLKHLVKEDPDFAKIAKETEADVHHIYNTVAEQEKGWARYLMKDGDMLGLTEGILCDYVDLVTEKRMKAIGYTYSGSVPEHHPIPWIEDRINSGKRQNALQETENDSYLLGITTGAIDVSNVADMFNSRFAVKVSKQSQAA